VWTITEALAFIRAIQVDANERGWYLALAGGVLNRGSSEHDLDIVAVPMNTATSSVEALRAVFQSHGLVLVRSSEEVKAGWGTTDNKHVEEWAYSAKRVDLITTEITRLAI
jgi:hypothetical protein